MIITRHFQQILDMLQIKDYLQFSVDGIDKLYKILIQIELLTMATSALVY